MAEELARLRTKFVEKVSKEIVNQLLDYLLDERVLNLGERESIIEENKSTANKARKLIDTVRKKGDNASNKLIIHLQKRHPKLYKDLCQSCGQAAESAAESQEQQGWSGTLIKTTKAFWIEKQSNNDIYPVTLNSVKNRVALLITNITFADENKNRRGAEKDEVNMEKLLTALGYEVVKHTNLTAKQMDEALVQFSKHPKLKETDSVFVVIMSHGKLGSILGVNFKPDLSSEEEADELPINNIFRHLNAEHCPELVDKPKIIIIQACRGDKKGAVLVCDGVESDQCLSAKGGDIKDDAKRYIHEEKDFIALLSCTPDTVSYRQHSQGSFLIQFIVEVFNTFAWKYDIEELFRKVMQRFENFPHPSLRQMATKDRCTIIRHFYLFPGLSHMN
uniref:Caspase 1 n=1 Tax=Bostrychus sinensis TaxID=86224 RepID=A0A6C0W5P7_9TELE|nr:caspase 1 [Bostrychus sinensis]